VTDLSGTVRPAYDGACITNAVRALQGGADWAPEATRGARCVVMLVLDGFGWDALEAHRDTLQTIGPMQGQAITSVVPSTTPTALTSFSTGAPPADHGILGYRLYTGKGVLNVIRWAMQNAPAPDPMVMQPREAFYGQPIPVVTRAQFRDTKFTEILYRGAPMHGYFSTSGLAQHCRVLSDAGERFIYAYYDGLDLVAHMHGMRNAFFTAELAFCDELVRGLLEALPDDVAVVVTADHGHIHFEGRIELGPLNDLCVAQAGESRFRYLHSKPGATADVLAAAKELVAGVGWALERDEVIDDGWFGPTPPSTDVRRRIGDVVATESSIETGGANAATRQG
jgi:predicted AlkP superfamily pyrophosphatase or phosphodiesterase